MCHEGYFVRDDFEFDSDQKVAWSLLQWTVMSALCQKQTSLSGIGIGLTRPVPFSFWIDRTSSGAFVWHRSLLEACQLT
jgi:hypothetical protein